MKKEKSKSKVVSESKKLKKELAEKLILAFTTVVNDFGKAKKSKSTIEKFAKQLSKKVDFKTKETAAPVVEQAAPVAAAKPKAVKKPAATADKK